MCSIHHHHQLHSHDVMTDTRQDKRQEDEFEQVADSGESCSDASCDTNTIHDEELAHIRQYIRVHDLCTPRPSTLVKTHFKIVINPIITSLAQKKEEAIHLLQRIQESVHSCTSEFDFSLISTKPLEWKGKYVRGNKSCFVSIFVYRDFGCDDDHIQEVDVSVTPQRPPYSSCGATFIIEVVRTKGDSKSFFDFYREFKQAMTGVDELLCSVETEYSMKLPLPLSLKIGEMPINHAKPSVMTVTVEKILKSTNCLNKMAMEPYFESRLEAARMLYDLSLKDPMTLSDSNVVQAVMTILEELLANRDSYFPEVVEQTIVACGSFCEFPCYRRTILQNEDCFLVILRLVGNPGKNEYFFDTAQVRRESARIIAMLCCSDVSAFVTQLQNCQVSWKKWLASLNQIKDTRMRVHTQKIQQVVAKRYLKADGNFNSRGTLPINNYNGSGGSYDNFDHFHY
jgi:hypothetical protein